MHAKKEGPRPAADLPNVATKVKKARSAKKQRVHKIKAATEKKDRDRFDRNFIVTDRGTALDFGLARFERCSFMDALDASLRRTAA